MPPHVEREEAGRVGVQGAAGHAQRPHHAACRAAQRQPSRLRRGHVDSGGAAVRLHDAHRTLPECCVEATEVAGHRRLHVRVDCRGGGALVLAVFGEEGTAPGDGHRVRKNLPEQGGGPRLVFGAQVRKEKHHRYALDLLGHEAPPHRPHGVFVEGRLNLPVRPYALGHFVAAFGGHERGWARGHQVVEGGAGLAADGEHVGEPVSRHQGRAGAAPLQQGVGGGGGAVDKGRTRGGTQRIEAGDHRLVLRRGRGHFAYLQAAGRGNENISKGAAHVDPYGRRTGSGSRRRHGEEAVGASRERSRRSGSGWRKSWAPWNALCSTQPLGK